MDENAVNGLRGAHLSSPEEREQCRDLILSNDAYDLIADVGANVFNLLDVDYDYCVEQVNRRYFIVHVENDRILPLSVENYIYSSIPKLYGLMDTTSMEAAGILRLHNQPYIELKGKGALIGFVDTGIDYTHPVFQYRNNRTRIAAIWDQTIQTGTPPKTMYYGSEYTEEQINQALQSDNPFDIVPSRDEDGHGTFMAGIAAGSSMPGDDFTGAAPEATIVAVKLKQAKQYLKDYYLVKEGVLAYQETDIMMACRYLLEVASQMERPIVIVIGLGNNMGGHTGNTTLGRYLENITSFLGTVVVTAAGNEGNRGTHYSGNLLEQQEYEEVELVVGENENGFCMEIWTQLPDYVTISLISPTGEVVPRKTGRIGENFQDTFLFERSIVYTNFRVLGGYMGENLIFMRFVTPAPGIWRIRVYPVERVSGRFDIWLPIQQFMMVDTRFLQPDPYITLTEPSTSLRVLTVATYNHLDNNIYLYSGRGYTRSGFIKPDLAAPGVNIFGPLPGGRYGVRTGSSIAAAHVAGAAAILLGWEMTDQPYSAMDTGAIKGYLIRGAERKPGVTYPNRQCGYGVLNLYRSFEVQRITE